MKKSLFKKVISIILVISMMASMAVYVSAADDDTITYVNGVLTYTLSTEDGVNVASNCL